jgi:hypothetical protein
MANRSPAKRLKSVDFPTFGLPTKATIGFMSINGFPDFLYGNPKGLEDL